MNDYREDQSIPPEPPYTCPYAGESECGKCTRNKGKDCKCLRKPKTTDENDPGNKQTPGDTEEEKK